MDEFTLGATVKELLDAAFPNVRLTDAGWFMVSLPDNPVKVQIDRLPDGSPVLNVESPVLFDIPSPRAETYELICLLQQGIPFGALIAVGSSTGDIHLAVRARLLPDGLTAGHLVRAVNLVHTAALAEIHHFRGFTPPVGGKRVSEL